MPRPPSVRSGTASAALVIRLRRLGGRPAPLPAYPRSPTRPMAGSPPPTPRAPTCPAPGIAIGLVKRPQRPVINAQIGEPPAVLPVDVDRILEDERQQDACGQSEHEAQAQLPRIESDQHERQRDWIDLEEAGERQG